MKYTGSAIIRATRAGHPPLSIDALTQFCGRRRSRLYEALRAFPPPFWLLDAIKEWHAKRGPLKPPAADKLFRAYVAKAWADAMKEIPSCPFKKQRGGAVKFTADDFEEDEDNDPPGGGGNGKGSKTQSTKSGLTQSTAGGSPSSSPNAPKNDLAQPGGNAQHGSVEKVGRWGKVSLLAEHLKYGDVFDQLAGIRDALKGLTETATPYEAAKVWADFCKSGQPSVTARRNAFIAHCETLPWAFKWKSGLARRKKIIETMNRLCGGGLRDRKCDEDRRQRWDQVCQFSLQQVAPIEADGHKKGAGKPRSWGDLEDSLATAWRVDQFRAIVFEILGKEVAFATFNKEFRNQYGQVSPMERAAERYLQECLGPQPEWAGQWMQMDGSEVPIKVIGGVGTARKDGVIDYPFAALTDVASLQTWLHTQGITSEVYLWGPLLKRFFIEQCYAPVKIVTDKGGRGFRTLQTQTPGTILQMEEGIALALAVGVEPYIHLPGNPRGKGSVESGGIKSGKKALKQVLAYRYIKAALTEMKAVRTSYRTIDSEDTWRRIQVEWEQGLNGRMLKRAFGGQFTRHQVWEREEYAAKRAERALVPDWEERWKAMWTNGLCVCVDVVGQKTLYLKDARVELSVPLPESLAHGSYAVLFPGGLRVGDDEKGDALLRGVVVEPRQGQPKYHTIECMRVNKNQLGFETDRPKAGEHPVARPETEHDQRVKEWFVAGKVPPAAAAARSARAEQPAEPESAADIIAAGKAAAG